MGITGLYINASTNGRDKEYWNREGGPSATRSENVDLRSLILPAAPAPPIPVSDFGSFDIRSPRALLQALFKH
jgi:hypothetical protein